MYQSTVPYAEPAVGSVARFRQRLREFGGGTALGGDVDGRTTLEVFGSMGGASGTAFRQRLRAFASA